MKKKLFLSHVLVFDDLPQVVSAYDNVKTKYICMLIEIEENEELKYIATPVSNERFSAFLDGLIDLRSVFKEPENKEYWVFQAIKDEIEAEYIKFDSLPEEYLPEQGYFYEKPAEKIISVHKIEESVNQLSTFLNETTSLLKGDPAKFDSKLLLKNLESQINDFQKQLYGKI